MSGATHSSSPGAPDGALDAALSDPARLAALHGTGLPYTPAEEAFDRLTRLAARLLAAPLALVNLVDDRRQFSKSCFAPATWPRAREASLSDSFCKYTVLTREPLSIEDTHEDPRVSSSAMVTELGVRSYLGIPLILPEGYALGTLCIADFSPRRWPEDDVQVLRDLAAQVVTEISLRRVVREHERTEQALRKSEERFRLLVERVEEYAIYMLDPEGRITSWNLGAERIKGYREEEILGKHVSVLYPEEDVRAGVPEHDLRAAAESGSLETEGWRVRRDGSRFWASVSTTAVRDGGLRGYAKVTRDLTERKRLEERLTLQDRALAAAAEGILISDAGAPDFPIIYANNGFEPLTGYSAAEVLGRNPRFLRGPGTDPRAVAETREAIRDGRPYVAELINYRKDGTPFWNRMSLAPVRDASGAVTHFIGVQQDVTGRVRAEEALRAAKEEAERANRAKSEFLSRMSHELRTPLNAILGFGQLLEADATDPDDRESVEQILLAGRHLLGLINEVLDIARIEAGRVSLSLEPVEVREVVEQTVDLVRPLAAQRGIRMEVDRARPCAGYVQADLQRLKQVLLNVLSNAVKYNHPGGTVTLSCQEVPEGRVRVAVRDTGPGIAPERLERLFIPFERAGAERTGVEGAGLGLALSRGLAELMGGSLGAESVPGEGSTFWIELPPAPPSEHLPEEEPAAEGATGASATHTVLYVEDNLSNFRLVERILAQRGDLRLLPAVQGRLGLDLAREHRPDLILLDLNLPDMHGEEVLRQVRADPALRHIPVVVISADATPAQVERLLSRGARAYLTKPLEVREFLRTTGEILRGLKA